MNTAIILMLLLPKSCKARKLYFTFKRVSRYGLLLCSYFVNYKLLTYHLDMLSNKLYKNYFPSGHTYVVTGNLFVQMFTMKLCHCVTKVGNSCGLNYVCPYEWFSVLTFRDVSMWANIAKHFLAYTWGHWGSIQVQAHLKPAIIPWLICTGQFNSFR